MTFRPLPIMTVFSVASLVVLIWLGNWQWGKYADKIGKPAAVAADAPEVLMLGFTPIAGAEVAPQRVYGIADGESIWRRYAMAQRLDTGAPVLLALDASGGANPADALAIPIDLDTPRAVRIFTRTGQASPRNDPDANLWYTFDRAALLAAFGQADGPVPVAEPVDLTVWNAANLTQNRTTTNPYGAPRPIDPLPPERHFGYALTWWGLAAALIGVYLAFHMAQGRLRIRSAS